MGLVVVWSFVSPLAVPCPRWFRLPFSLVRVRRWSSRAAVVLFVLNVGSRLVLVLVLRVWPWFWSCAVFSFYFSLWSALRVGRPMPKLGNFRCKLVLFK